MKSKMLLRLVLTRIFLPLVFALGWLPAATLVAEANLTRHLAEYQRTAGMFFETGGAMIPEEQ